MVATEDSLDGLKLVLEDVDGMRLLEGTEDSLDGIRLLEDTSDSFDEMKLLRVLCLMEELLDLVLNEDSLDVMELLEDVDGMKQSRVLCLTAKCCSRQSSLSMILLQSLHSPVSPPKYFFISPLK